MSIEKMLIFVSSIREIKWPLGEKKMTVTFLHTTKFNVREIGNRYPAMPINHLRYLHA